MRKRTVALLKQGMAVMMAAALAFGPCAAGSIPAFASQTETGTAAAAEGGEDAAADHAAAADQDVAADHDIAADHAAAADAEDVAAADASEGSGASEAGGDMEAEEIIDDTVTAEDAEIEGEPEAAEETAAEEVPAEENAAETAGAEETAEEETAAETVGAGETAEEEKSAEEIPAEETAAETVGAEETAVEETAAEEIPAGETAAETVGAEETAAEETAETAAAEETAAEETAAAEKSASTETLARQEAVSETFTVTFDYGRKVVWKHKNGYRYIGLSSSGTPFVGSIEDFDGSETSYDAAVSEACQVFSYDVAKDEKLGIRARAPYRNACIEIGGMPQVLTGWTGDDGTELSPEDTYNYVPESDVTFHAEWTSDICEVEVDLGREVVWKEDQGYYAAIFSSDGLGFLNETSAAAAKRYAERSTVLYISAGESLKYNLGLMGRPVLIDGELLTMEGWDASTGERFDPWNSYDYIPSGDMTLTLRWAKDSGAGDDEIRVTSVRINTPARTMTTGATFQLAAWPQPANAANKNVTWISSDPSVASVSRTGLVKAVKAGTATVTVRTADGGFTNTCVITVRSPAVTGVKINTEARTLFSGKTFQLAAWPQPANAGNKAVTWTSSRPTVAKVSSTGLVTAVMPGTANVTVKTVDGGFTKTCRITVQTQPVTGVKINTAARTITAGRTFQMAAWPQPASAGNKAVTWTSSNTAVARVNSAGLVTAVKPGTATVTVKTADGGYTASCKITVRASSVTGVVINIKSVYMYQGRTFQLAAWPQPSTAANRQVTWTSSRPSVAKVNSAGLVTGLTAGTAVITVKTADGGYTETCTVTVAPPLVNR